MSASPHLHQPLSIPVDRPTAIFRQHGLDAFMQARLRQRMGHDGTGDEEQRQEKEQLERHQAEACLQGQAKEQKPDAERVDDAGRMHAGEDVRHADEPERTDDRKERSEQNERPACDLDCERHDPAPSVASWARSPWRKNFRTASVPIRLSSP